LLESSFAQFQADRGVVGIARRLRRVQQQAGDLAKSMACEQGDFTEYIGIRRQLTDLEKDGSRSRASSRRAQALRSLPLLRRGDIIAVPGGRRAGLAVVLSAPPASVAEGPQPPRRTTADGPLVLTSAGQVKQLWAADFPVPAEPVDRVKIPASFSERSPKHRRDLVSAMRSKLAGRDLDDFPRNGSAEYRRRGGASPGGSANGSDGPAQDGGGVPHDVAELRRKLRRHPCHDCPDREEHARYAERFVRLQRDAEELERQISGRSHVIARTFERVCSVLDRLGYLDGDRVTPDGRRLGRLYSELDLLAAECLRRGFWEGLNPAELAACVSVLTFESRLQADDAQPARLPKGPVRDVLDDMSRTWVELEHLERRNRLSFMREPDPGFVWAAYRWVRGAKLEDVLESAPGLTPGDFVRAIKQLMDLLDQIAVAASSQGAAATAVGATASDTVSGGAAAVAAQATADSDPQARRSRGVAETARSAIDAMRRGVVAYTTLTD
jgi:ATP-dependent RNA helicase HelY